jgi:hypothetical protein
MVALMLSRTKGSFGGNGSTPPSSTLTSFRTAARRSALALVGGGSAQTSVAMVTPVLAVEYDLDEGQQQPHHEQQDQPPGLVVVVRSGVPPQPEQGRQTRQVCGAGQAPEHGQDGEEAGQAALTRWCSTDPVDPRCGVPVSTGLHECVSTVHVLRIAVILDL